MHTREGKEGVVIYIYMSVNQESYVILGVDKEIFIEAPIQLNCKCYICIIKLKILPFQMIKSIAPNQKLKIICGADISFFHSLRV